MITYKNPLAKEENNIVNVPDVEKKEEKRTLKQLA